MSDWNTNVIDEFRANGGRVGGPFEGAPLLLLHTIGRKSGLVRVTPLMYLPDDGRWAIFASKAGHPSHPHWFLNLDANPRASVEIGAETLPVKATVLREGTERDALYARQVALYPQFGEYEVKTIGHRIIPVIMLERAA